MVKVTILLRILTIILILGTYVYWKITGKKAEKEKPKKKSIFSLLTLVNFAIPVATSGLVILQLCGLPFLPIEHPSLSTSILGFVFVIIGTGISISARKTLGTNWTHAAEKQINKGKY